MELDVNAYFISSLFLWEFALSGLQVKRKIKTIANFLSFSRLNSQESNGVGTILEGTGTVDP